MNSEAGLTDAQRLLLHATLRDLHHAREKLRGIKLLQRVSRQPKLVAATEEIEKHLQHLWCLVDGLDMKDPMAKELVQPAVV